MLRKYNILSKEQFGVGSGNIGINQAIEHAKKLS